MCERTLVLYNDEFSGTDVEVNVSIVCNNTIVASGKKTISVPLGEHFDIPVSFRVPFVKNGRGDGPVQTAGTPCKIVLTTAKNGGRKIQGSQEFLYPRYWNTLVRLMLL